MKLPEWIVKSSKVVYETQWIRAKEDHCSVDGKSVVYSYTQRKDAGPLIIAEENNKLWMVRQYRHPVRKFIWQFPAEGVMPGETWEDAAQRGLEEELGKRAHVLVDLGLTHPDPGGLEQTSHFFYATDLYRTESHGNPHDGVEDLEIKAFSLQEIEQMIQSGEICDSWTFAALFLYQRCRNK